jgi:type IV pilus assembly protein PilA
MRDWYYSTGGDQRRGPLTSEALIAQFREGRVGLDTLVWHDGQDQWKPLGDFAAELGLTASAIPPPLPSQLGPIPQPVAARPRSGLSGCMIALILVAALVIPLAAILAAIALPAYNDYVMRSQVVSALAVAEPAKAAVATYFVGKGVCPENEEAGFGTPASYAAGTVASISFGRFESELCGMELILAVPGKEALDGKAVWLEYEPSGSSWQCTSEVEDKLLPAKCRG